jgi:hypothetical protein
MPITTGNFQDLVQLTQDTLYHLGPDLELGNSLSASTVSIGFNNTAGDLQLAASATGNATAWLPSGGGTLLSNIRVSAGTTSNLLSAITFSNSNNVTFGLNGSTMTASFNADAQAIGAISAGTQQATSGTVIFSNSNGVTFGMSGSATITASAVASINISAGTTSNNMSAVTFSNSNGISFGLNGSTVTAQNGGISSWSVPGGAATAISMGANSLYFEAVQIPYCITVTNLLFLVSVTNHSSNVSGGFSLSAALYTLNGGTAGSLSLASSGSSNITWTSGAALSSNTGINYQQMTVNSWVVTPGPYLFAFWFSTQNSVSMSIYGPAEQPSISSGMVAAMSNLMLNGVSQATTNALPSSFGISNTASYIRTGATAAQQPFVIMQGT